MVSHLREFTDSGLAPQAFVQLYRGWTYWLASGVAPPPERHQSRIRCKDCGGPLSVTMMVGANGGILWKRPLPNHALAYCDSG